MYIIHFHICLYVPFCASFSPSLCDSISLCKMTTLYFFFCLAF